MAIKCNLIIDSCCDLPHDVVDREGVYLVKFPYFDDDGEHLDDLYQSNTAHDFYERYEKRKRASYGASSYASTSGSLSMGN